MTKQRRCRYCADLLHSGQHLLCWPCFRLMAWTALVTAVVTFAVDTILWWVL